MTRIVEPASTEIPRPEYAGTSIEVGIACSDDMTFSDARLASRIVDPVFVNWRREYFLTHDISAGGCIAA